MQRFAHVYSAQALKPQLFSFSNGGNSQYYSFSNSANKGEADTLIFFYGGSGCYSWKYTMPDYVKELKHPAQIFALNKRFVSDRKTGAFGCSSEFHHENIPKQWVADYSEFISAQLLKAKSKPNNVVLVGISEGALPALVVSTMIPEITHLVIIGDGGFTMRKAITTLQDKENWKANVDKAWNNILSDPQSIEKKWLGNPYLWWSNIMDFDPLPYFMKLNIPIIVAMGELDRSVPVESAYFLKEKFKLDGKDNLTTNIYLGADHLLQSSVSHRDQLFSELGSWILNN